MFPLLLDRLLEARNILLKSLYSVYGNDIDSSTGYLALSSAREDLLKNTALCMLRLHGLMSIAYKFQHVFREAISNKKIKKLLFQSPSFLTDLISSSSALEDVTKDAIFVIKSFLRESPRDKDVITFKNFLLSIESIREEK